MATPTPGSASKRTAANGLTPRSAPSPATARKTPINHPTTSSSQGSKTLASTPMVHTLSQTGNTASPSANMLSFNTPSGLGIDGITPHLNMPTPSLTGGTAMMPTMSELGLTASGGSKRDEDEERRSKMRKVLKAIGRPKGRVSEEGIARIARRVGFPTDIDYEKVAPEGKAGNRTISFAGNAVVISIDMAHHIPRQVQVTYSTQTKALEEQGEKAGRVLLQDLSGAATPLQSTLDTFAANLERLARIDRVSGAGINCFEALGGVYAGLVRLWESEMEVARGLLKERGVEGDERVRDEVMCKGSGRPVMHERRKLGFAIEYWRDGDAEQVSEPADTTDRMDVDDSPTVTSSTAPPFSLAISIEPNHTPLYPSLRTSELWLPDPLPSPSEMNGVIPWEEPPPTFLSTDPTQLPSVRFTAHLDPPLTMPYQTAMNILASVGWTQQPVMPYVQPYATLLLLAQSNLPQNNSSGSISAERELYTRLPESTTKHFYTLETVKPDWGTALTELPFAHPRMLVELLPTLRQWARVAKLLRGTMLNATAGVSSNIAAAADTSDSSLDELMVENDESNGSHTLVGDDAATSPPVLSTPESMASTPREFSASTVTREDGVAISLSLATSPTPTISLRFPTAASTTAGGVALGSGKVARVSVQVLPNGGVAVSGFNGLKLDGRPGKSDGEIGVEDDGTPGSDAMDEEAKRMKLARTLGRALEAAADLGVWVEWVRWKFT